MNMWSSTSQLHLSLTAHYVSSDGSCAALTLRQATCPWTTRDTIIANGLREFFHLWHLKEDKQACVTWDSGANVVKAIVPNSWMTNTLQPSWAWAAAMTARHDGQTVTQPLHCENLLKSNIFKPLRS